MCGGAPMQIFRRARGVVWRWRLLAAHASRVGRRRSGENRRPMSAVARHRTSSGPKPERGARRVVLARSRHWRSLSYGGSAAEHRMGTTAATRSFPLLLMSLIGLARRSGAAGPRRHHRLARRFAPSGRMRGGPRHPQIWQFRPMRRLAVARRATAGQKPPDRVSRVRPYVEIPVHHIPRCCSVRVTRGPVVLRCYASPVSCPRRHDPLSRSAVATEII